MSLRLFRLFVIPLMLSIPTVTSADTDTPEIGSAEIDTTETSLNHTHPSKDDNTRAHETSLFSYEPTTVSWTGEGKECFLAYKMSFQFALSDTIESYLEGRNKWYFDTVRAAMTLGGGFYVGSRHSSPVVGKRFNPKVFVRSYFQKYGYIDLGFCHESNGQSISSEKEFTVAMEEAESHGDARETARDLISRSWNFLELKVGTSNLWHPQWYGEITITDPFSGSIGFGRTALPRWEREFLNEARDNKHNVTSRAQIHGITLLAGRESEEGHQISYDVELTTGIRNPKRPISSIRIEASFVIWERLPIPIYVHYFNGFAYDLAEFYRESESIGVGLRFNAHHTKHYSRDVPSSEPAGADSHNHSR